MHHHKFRPEIIAGPIAPTLLSLAYPNMLAMLLQTIYSLIDTLLMGWVGTDELTAISLSFPISFILVNFAFGVGVGVNSLVARAIGARNQEQAEQIATQSLLIALVLAGAFTLIGFVFAENIYCFMGAEGRVLELSLSYIKIILLGNIFLFLQNIGTAILRGEGDMLASSRVMMTATLVNLGLDPLLIFGLAGLPALGVNGAAWATNLGRITGCLMLLRHFCQQKSSIHLQLRGFRYSSTLTRQLVELALPMAFSRLTIPLVSVFLNKLMMSLTPFAVAARGIGSRLDAIAFLPAQGLASATVTMVGQNLGAGKNKRARQVVTTAGWLAVGGMAAVGTAFFAMAPVIIARFSANPQIGYIGVQYLHIVVFSYPFIAIDMVNNAAFQGLGLGWPTLVITLCRVWALQLPSAYFFALTLGWGTSGVWFALVFANALASMASILLLRYFLNKKAAALNQPDRTL